jgi:hypothetical protein
MKAGNYYYITSLPMLGKPGDAPPISLADLLEHLADNPSARKAAATIFLLYDLLQREAVLCGEIKVIDPAILTLRQIRNEEPLPAYLTAVDEKNTKTVRIDNLWENYFRYAYGVAEEIGSRFLKEWISFEVSLRNALAVQRAKKLGLEPGPYLVASDLDETGEDFSGVLRDWAAAVNPLAGHKVLTLARWQWLANHDAWFSFENDELAAYAAKDMVLQQWYRLIAAGAEKAKADDSK